MLVPKSVDCLRNYSWQQFSKDLVAGLVVGVVALPLAMAFAIASGVKPEQGLFTAIIAGFLISALGGSRVQIGGPTGAFVVIVFGIVAKYDYAGLAVATLMAGIMLIIMGVSKMGAAVKFIPYPVTAGFTSGIAVVIFSTQVDDFLGLHLGQLPPEFHEKWTAYLSHLAQMHAPTVALSCLSLFILIVWPYLTRKVPGPIVVMVVATVLARLMDLWGWHVETIGDKFHQIPNMLPVPHIPAFTWEDTQKLIGPAFTIAMLGAIESLLSAVVADGMTGGRHRPNIELVAQGVANIASPLFGGIPATGAIARTATNVKTGAKTPVAGMIHAVTLLAIMFFCAPLAVYVPLCALASILIVVAWHMAEVHTFYALLKSPRADAFVLVVTFLLTVIFDLTIAVQVGLVLSASLFIKRMADVTNVQVVTRELKDARNGESDDPNDIGKRSVPDGVEVYEVNGPFFFGVVDKVKDVVQEVQGKCKVFILRMRNVPAMDASGLHALLHLRRNCERDGCTLILSEIHTQPFIALDHSGHKEEFGPENVVAHIDDALNRAREILQLPKEDSQLPRVPEVARDKTDQ